jgi:hypothetical protein
MWQCLGFDTIESEGLGSLEGECGILECDYQIYNGRALKLGYLSFDGE